MKLPSEDVIQAVISELIAHQTEVHKNKSEDEKCDFCELCDELDKRNDKIGKEGMCCIDQIPPNFIASLNLGQESPQATVGLMVGGQALFGVIVLIARISFLIGAKSNQALMESEKLNSLMES